MLCQLPFSVKEQANRSCADETEQSLVLTSVELTGTGSGSVGVKILVVKAASQNKPFAVTVL